TCPIDLPVSLRQKETIVSYSLNIRKKSNLMNVDVGLVIWQLISKTASLTDLQFTNSRVRVNKRRVVHAGR
uniref:hypothetical protein n=1 Tax=Flavisolibacter nicotianae TaxID=2364882 RepID=UPI0019693EDD